MSEKRYQRSLLFGCGDVGRRIATHLISSGVPTANICGYVNSKRSAELANELGVACCRIDIDADTLSLIACHGTEMYYTVAPQKKGTRDERSQRVIKEFLTHGIRPNRVVLISTTGVYGDSEGSWVSEQSSTNPKTERGKRRLDSENRWLAWGKAEAIDVVVLRVPGIYAFSRLPRERLKKMTPVVRASECGYSNRIHADDLARACVQSMYKAPAGEVYNVSDGRPGKISEYLQAAANALGLEPLPEISMDQAQKELSVGMLSYLSESRKISNEKILGGLGFKLLYPDFKLGLLK